MQTTCSPGADQGTSPEQPYCHCAADPFAGARAGRCAHGALAAEYYAQRADAGLLIAEATQISPVGKGYAGALGDLQRSASAGLAADYRRRARQGRRMAYQLWHVGRVSHTSLQPGTPPQWPHRRLPPTPTPWCAIRWPIGRAPCSLPRALETAEIADLIEDYRRATDRSRRAGFDLVEVRRAWLSLHQFRSPLANQRTDQYGGSVENRARLTLEVVDAVIGDGTAPCRHPHFAAGHFQRPGRHRPN